MIFFLFFIHCNNKNSDLRIFTTRKEKIMSVIDGANLLDDMGDLQLIRCKYFITSYVQLVSELLGMFLCHTIYFMFM